MKCIKRIPAPALAPCRRSGARRFGTTFAPAVALASVVLAGHATLEAATPSAEDPQPEGARLNLTLAQTLEMTLRNNPTLVAERLERPLQKYDLEVAEAWFWPQLTSGAVRTEYVRDNLTGATEYRLSAGPLLHMRLPTGGEVSVGPSWVATATRDGDGRSIHDDREALGFTLWQPLLKGGGLTAGRAPVLLARVAEERNVLRFRDALMDVLRDTILTYRALIQAEQRVSIDERSLARARETLEVNRVLIGTGRMAEQDITQTEANIAQRELSLVKSQDALDDARRNLNVLLDLPGTVLVTPAEAVEFDEDEAGGFDVAASVALARQHNPAYLGAMLAVRRAEIERVLADNNARWDLALTARADSGGVGGSVRRDLGGAGDDSRYAVGLELRIPLGDDAAKADRRQRLAASTALQRAEFALANYGRELDTNVRNAVRAARTRLQEVRLARAALALAEAKLEIEREKLSLGLSSNYQLALFETDLVNAQVNDVAARIGYLNALTALDHIQGTVLDTWGIDAAAAWEPPQ